MDLSLEGNKNIPINSSSLSGDYPLCLEKMAMMLFHFILTSSKLSDCSY